MLPRLPEGILTGKFTSGAAEMSKPYLTESGQARGDHI